MGWLTRWEMAIGMQLLEDDWIGLGGRYFVKFNVNALLRGDFKSRMEGYSTGMQWGFMTPSRSPTSRIGRRPPAWTRRFAH